MLKRMVLLVALLVLFPGASQAGEWIRCVPEKTALVIGVNLAEAMETPIGKKMLEESTARQTPEQKKAAQEFITKAGIDPFRTIKNVYVFIGAKGENPEETAKNGALIVGNFDPAKVLKAIQEDKTSAGDMICEKFEGLDAVKNKKTPDSMGVFLDKSTVLIGNAEVVKAVLKLKNGKAKDLGKDPVFSSLLKKIENTGVVWGAGLVSPFMKARFKTNPNVAPLAALDAISFSFKFQSGLDFLFQGDIGDKARMEGLLTALNGILALVKTATAQTPELGELFQTLNVEGTGTKLKVTMKVDQKKLDDLGSKMQGKLNAVPEGKPAK